MSCNLIKEGSITSVIYTYIRAYAFDKLLQ